MCNKRDKDIMQNVEVI